MNRTLALLLTLAILVAHMLAIHTNRADAIAPPYEEAHVAFRFARNFVESGSLAWDQGKPPAEGYSSLLWVMLAALGETLWLPVTAFCQTVGAISSLLTIFCLAQFSPGRLAGVIAPLLFVVSGAVAAAAASGAETSTLALFVCASFLAFERRAKLPFAIATCLCVAIRAEGIVFTLMLLLLEIAGQLRNPSTPRVSLLRWFLPAVVVVCALMLLRNHLHGTWLSPFTQSLTDPSLERWRTGVSYVGDFVRGSGWTILLVFPLYYLARGSLRGGGRRALVLSLGYALTVACMGGGHGPMFQPMVPMISLVLIAIQESMTIALDSRRRIWPQTTWTLFLVALSTSALASKYPGDLGPLPTEALHRRWLTGTTPPRLSYVEPLGRLGLVEEIEVSERLRSLGSFMREQLDPQSRVLSPWPGALGYISRLPVIDVLGRASCDPSESHPRPWSGVQRTDLLAVLALAPEYIVPAINWQPLIPRTPQEISAQWSAAFDIEPSDSGRTAAVCDALRSYELITVPVPIVSSDKQRGPTRPFHLLRRRDLGLAPKLEVEVNGREYRVSVMHRATHEQQVDLRVILRDSSGGRWSIEPTGTLRAGATSMLRTSIRLFNTGNRSIELASGTLPEGVEIVELRAVLRNPLARGEHPYCFASESVVELISR